MPTRNGAAGGLPLPRSRGPLSAAVVDVLTGKRPVHTLPSAAEEYLAGRSGSTFLTDDDDFQIALFMLGELHYRGIDGVDDRLEWDLSVLAASHALEAAYEAELRERVAVGPLPAPEPDQVSRHLFSLTKAEGGPSLSRHVARRADVVQAREFLVHKSIYQLKEADPHTWAIPRLAGRAKAAMVEIQADEYGDGAPQAMHAAVFARSLRGAGLDDRYGAYIDRVPAVTLAASTAMSLFGLHRRLRGAIVGHLAALEMTSSIPNALYSRGFERLGFDAGTREYFDVHVEADAVHEQIAGFDLAGSLAEDEPELLGDIVFGAATCLALDEWAAEWILARWSAGESSLLAP